MNERERHMELIGRYVDGAASADEARELEAALVHDAELRRAFLRYLHLDAALGGTPAALLALEAAPPASAGQALMRRWAGWAAAAAAVLLFALFARYPIPAPFATLTAATDAVWADPNVELALRNGELPPGLLRLDAGSAEFLCADGAAVVVRGPAALQFPGRKRVFVAEGRVFCRCPSPESRLSVETPATRVVDLGTEFCVEARADQTTRVAVLSGEVQVGTEQPRRLRKGEAVEVRGDGILAIQPLARDEFAELLVASPSVSDAVRNGVNRLRDPGFDQGLQASTWSGTESNIDAAPNAGRSGGAVRIAARGYAHWPQCRQKLQTGDIAGRLVVASVWGAVDPEDPLHARQLAMLKLVFVNEKGRDFAFAMRRFLGPNSPSGRFEPVQVAAYAPPGTRSVQIQLMLQSNLQNSGSVLFDDASLVIADSPAGE